jgi:hypothetical protein
MALFNDRDAVRAPGELRAEIVDHVVNERALLWKVTQILEPDGLGEPPSDEFCDAIEEEVFLRRVGLLPEVLGGGDSS